MSRQLFFSAQGRMARGSYWLVTITLVVVALFLYVVLRGVSLKLEQWRAGGVHASHASTVSMLLVFAVVFFTLLILLWSAVCIRIKRWHDLNFSGWMTLLSFIPYLGTLIDLFALGCLRSNQGPNRFGVDPRAVP